MIHPELLLLDGKVLCGDRPKRPYRWAFSLEQRVSERGAPSSATVAL